MARRTKIHGWRKIAAAAWSGPNDPQIFGDVELDATNLLAFVESARAKGTKLSVTHMVGRALAHGFRENPDLNVRIRRGHFIERESIDIFFIVSAEAGSELSGVKIEHADRKSAVEIADELATRAGRIRTGEDVEFGKTKRMFARTPRRLLRTGFRAATWITTDLNLDLKKYGLPRQAFGSAMVSSVGMFGIQHAYAPLAFYYKVPLLVLVGEVALRPAVVEERIEARPLLNLAATLDHRYLDGFHAARMARAVREYLEDPKRFEPAV